MKYLQIRIKQNLKLVHTCKEEKMAINSNEMKHSVDAIIGNYNNILKRKQNTWFAWSATSYNITAHLLIT